MTSWETIFSEYFYFVDHPDHPDYQQIYTIAAFLSPYHQAMLSPREKEAKEYLRSGVSLMEDSMVGMGVEENIAVTSAPLNMDSANNMMPGCDLLFDLIQEGEIGNDE